MTSEPPWTYVRRTAPDATFKTRPEPSWSPRSGDLVGSVAGAWLQFRAAALVHEASKGAGLPVHLLALATGESDENQRRKLNGEQRADAADIAAWVAFACPSDDLAVGRGNLFPQSYAAWVTWHREGMPVILSPTPDLCDLQWHHIADELRKRADEEDVAGRGWLVGDETGRLWLVQGLEQERLSSTRLRPGDDGIVLVDPSISGGALAVWAASTYETTVASTAAAGRLLHRLLTLARSNTAFACIVVVASPLGRTDVSTVVPGFPGEVGTRMTISVDTFGRVASPTRSGWLSPADIELTVVASTTGPTTGWSVDVLVIEKVPSI